jgi:hypothetical protein
LSEYRTFRILHLRQSNGNDRTDGWFERVPERFEQLVKFSEVGDLAPNVATKRESGVCDVFARYLWAEVSALTGLPEDDWQHDGRDSG